MTSPVDRVPGAPVGTARWKYLLLLVASIGIVYAQSLRFDFVTYDDYELVVQNGDFLSRVSNIAASFTTHVFTTHRAQSGYYRPLLLMSYIFDYQIWGLNPFGYHLTNIVLHCCTAVVVFLLLERLLKHRLAALLGSLLFALHPLQTESVAWVAGRNDVLLGLFVSIMLLAYLYYREETASRNLYLISVAAFALALFTKESAAFYILLLPLYELCVDDRLRLRNALRRVLPFLGVLMLYLVARWNAIGEVIGAERLYGTLPFADRFHQLPAIVSEHCTLALLPLQLSIVHPPEQLRWLFFPWTIAALLIPLSLLGITWYCRRKDGVICFGLLWFLVGLLPLLGLVPVAVPILEHRLYLPLVGLALAAARIVSLLSVRKSSTLVTLLLGIIIAVFAVASFLRLPVWRDSTTLWTDAIEKAPAVSRSYFNLAGYYFEHQQYDSTARLLKQYIELKPDDFLGYSKLRQAYFLAGRYEDAGFVSRQIIARNPLNAYRYLEAGMMYEQLHRYDSAAALYHEGLAVDSNAAVLRFHLGAVYAAQQDTMRAIDMIERGMNTGTPAPESVRLLHELYARTGQDVKARQLSERYHF